MLNIKLAENWKIKADSKQYVLIKEEDGREQVEGYYTRLQHAIESFIQRKIRHSNASSIFSLIQYLKHLQASLNKALQPLKLEVMPISEENE